MAPRIVFRHTLESAKIFGVLGSETFHTITFGVSTVEEAEALFNRRRHTVMCKNDEDNVYITVNFKQFRAVKNVVLDRIKK